MRIWRKLVQRKAIIKFDDKSLKNVVILNEIIIYAQKLWVFNCLYFNGPDDSLCLGMLWCCSNRLHNIINIK